MIEPDICTTLDVPRGGCIPRYTRTLYQRGCSNRRVTVSPNGPRRIPRYTPVRRTLDGLPVGTTLDAACGTGRHPTYLRALGHDVIGVDASPEMLAQARKRLPDVAFYEADLHRLPLPDNAVDTSSARSY